MTHSKRSSTRSWSSLALACVSLSFPAVGLRADEPDALPLPRMRTPQALKLPAADTTPAPNEGAKDSAPAKPDAASDAELPRPAGKPGRAPDPDGAKADGAKKETKKDDAKKEPPPPDGRCDDCGSCVCVTKVCAPKLGKKEITKVCWDSKCEDFCVPGRSQWCGTACQKDDCGCWSHEVWKPTCAEVRTRVVPVRKTTKRTVPSVEWKVVERCACCRAKAPCGEVPKQEGDAKDAAAKGPVEKPAPAKPDGDAPKKTAALPGFHWPWATWLR